MCNLYHVTPKGDAERYLGKIGRQMSLPGYSMRTVGPGQRGMIIRPARGELECIEARWGMIKPGSTPKQAESQRHLTNNARLETVHELPTYAPSWRDGQRCLIPALWLQEPNWETGKNVWWHLARADGLPWMIAGIWSDWTNRDTGELILSYSMITMNVNSHPLLSRLHRPDLDPDTGKPLPLERQDKRGEAHIDPGDWDAWLYGSEADARALLQPPELAMFDLREAEAMDEALGRLAAGKPAFKTAQDELF